MTAPAGAVHESVTVDPLTLAARFVGAAGSGSGAPIVKNTSPLGPLVPHALVAVTRAKNVPPGTVPPIDVCVPSSTSVATLLDPADVPARNV